MEIKVGANVPDSQREDYNDELIARVSIGAQSSSQKIASNASEPNASRSKDGAESVDSSPEGGQKCSTRSMLLELLQFPHSDTPVSAGRRWSWRRAA